jgi:hypothetical protein
VGEVSDYLREHGTWLIQSGYANESIQTRDLGIKVFRAATLLRRFSLGGRIVPTVEDSAPAPAVAPADGRIADPLALARFEYRVTEPILPPDADSPVMNKRQMEDWLNDMDAQGWEFLSYGATYWHNKDIPQEWWVFRRPRQVDPIRMNESKDTLFKLKAAPAPAVVPVAVSEWDNGFMAGVCAALAVVKDHDDGTVWREIVRSVGTDHALNYAANVNPEDWELAGFSTYAQSELGKGKPDPLPQVGEVEA